MGWERFVTVQAHHHLLEREVERELVPFCKYAKVGLLPYFPLAGGFLTGKYERGEPAPQGTRGARSPYVQKYLTDANFDKLDKLRAFAESRGRTLHGLAFAWLLSRDFIPSVIAGATKPEQVEANAATVDWKLTDEDLAELQELL
jgi:aryl-alcohol dehydrogenase-like predicted oxidoreductase